MPRKLKLEVEDLERRIAPGLLLPNGEVIFGNFMLPNGDPHPVGPHGGDNSGFPGPWNATEVFGGPLGFRLS